MSVWEIMKKYLKSGKKFIMTAGNSWEMQNYLKKFYMSKDLWLLYQELVKLYEEGMAKGIHVSSLIRFW